VLITGGTAAARRLADALAAGFEVTYALAGITQAPALPRHERVRVRIGGFGGAAGLAQWLAAQGIAAVIDATHPHARAMPRQVPCCTDKPPFTCASHHFRKQPGMVAPRPLQSRLFGHSCERESAFQRKD
jgi:hypothetical protein